MKRRLVVVVLVTFAAGALAFACGSDDGDGPTACEGAACADGSSEGNAPIDAATETTTTNDGGVDARVDAADGGDASDSGSTCSGDAGSLDPAFGPAGVAVIAFPGEPAFPKALILQPDGKIMIGGRLTLADGDHFALFRLMPNGTLDTTFGTAGVAETRIGTMTNEPGRIVAQPDGKILFAGTVYRSDADIALLRFNTDGTLDTTFGTNGVVLTNFEPGSTDQGAAVALMPDGRIVVSGQAQLPGFPPTRGAAFVRYLADGSLDTTFGTGGYTTVVVRGKGDQASSLALLPSGKIVATGLSLDPTVFRLDLLALRLDADGSLDTTFADGGAFVSTGGPGSDYANGVRLDSSGRVVIAGAANDSEIAITRLTTAGALDTTFGGTGLVRTKITAGVDSAYALAFESDGRIFAAGRALPGGTLIDAGVGFLRYFPDGGLDPSFAGTGKLMIPLPTGFKSAEPAFAMAVDGCTALVVGPWTDEATNESRIGLMRIRR